MTKKKSSAKDGGVSVDIPSKNGTLKTLFFERINRKLTLTDAGCAYIEKMASFGCSVRDIADELGISRQTLSAQHNRAKLDQAVKKGRGQLKNGLRVTQVKTAHRGNSAMLIFLGKNYLGQCETPAPSDDNVSPLNEFAKVFAAREKQLESEDSDADFASDEN
ncbi:MAG: hypothetical protein WC082_08715 [Victivallales bacterium]